jgi:hypothetical protein
LRTLNQRKLILKYIRQTLNILIIGSIALILYTFLGKGYVDFEDVGKIEILKAADEINSLCQQNNSCPTDQEAKAIIVEANLKISGSMIIYSPDVSKDDSDAQKQNIDTFRLIYAFFPPESDWYEVQGGVGETITSGWKEYQEPID